MKGTRGGDHIVELAVLNTVDVHTGILLATLDEFVQSKSYVVCVFTPDARFVLVGEPAETRMFALTPADDPAPEDDDVDVGGLRRHLPVARFPATYPPSALAVSADSRCAFVGQSFDCLLSVLDIDPNSSGFGQVSCCISLIYSATAVLFSCSVYAYCHCQFVGSPS